MLNKKTPTKMNENKRVDLNLSVNLVNDIIIIH